MFINRKKIKKLLSIVFVLIIMLVPSTFLLIQDIFAESSIEANEEIDLRLGAIEDLDNVQQIPDLIYIMETLLRAPITQIKDGEPPYNQEPPDAQDDFRGRITPAPPTIAPPTFAPPTIAPPTIAPPTFAPPTIAPPTRPPLPPPTRFPFPPPTTRPIPTIPPPPPPPPPTQPPQPTQPPNF